MPVINSTFSAQSPAPLGPVAGGVNSVLLPAMVVLLLNPKAPHKPISG
jgi:hypothetical protein